jgi:hypothetical protein
MKNICFKDVIRVQFGICNNSHARVYPSKKLRFEAQGLRVNSALPVEVCILENLRTEPNSNVYILELNQTEQFGKKFGNSSRGSSQYLLEK